MMLKGLCLTAVLSVCCLGSNITHADQIIKAGTYRSYWAEPGIGYDDKTHEFKRMSCVESSVTDEIVEVPSVPFSDPVIVTHDLNFEVPAGEVRIVFSAYSKLRRNLILQRPYKMVAFPNPNKELVCGTTFVKVEQVAGAINISMLYHTAEGSEKALATLLGTVHDLREIITFQVNDPAISIHGRGISFNATGTDEETSWLSKAGFDCFFNGKCQEFVDTAYAHASELDIRYTKERVSKLVSVGPSGTRPDFGVPVQFTVAPYE